MVGGIDEKECEKRCKAMKGRGIGRKRKKWGGCGEEVMNKGKDGGAGREGKRYSSRAGRWMERRGLCAHWKVGSSEV